MDYALVTNLVCPFFAHLSCVLVVDLTSMAADDVIAGVGVVVVNFDGLSVEATDGWLTSQPSLTCVDDGVGLVDCCSVVKVTVAS